MGAVHVQQHARVYLLTGFVLLKPGLETGVGMHSLRATTLHKPPLFCFSFLNAEGFGDNAPVVICSSC
jgi:hypothetical protein